MTRGHRGSLLLRCRTFSCPFSRPVYPGAPQITRYLDQALAAGKLGHDRGEDPALPVEGAVIFLDDARRSAAALAGDLDAAWQQLALVNGHPAPQPKDQP